MNPKRKVAIVGIVFVGFLATAIILSAVFLGDYFSDITKAEILGALIGASLTAFLVTIALMVGGPYFSSTKLRLSNRSLANGTASQIHLAWRDDPATTLSVLWRTACFDNPSVVRYRSVGNDGWREAKGDLPINTA